MEIIGVGELAVTGTPGSSIRTYGLGSCVALMIWDPAKKVAGMAHIALPESTFNANRATKLPGYFADTAVPSLVNEMKAAGCRFDSNCRMSVKLAGGSRVIDGQDVFKIGQRNVEKVKRLLLQYGLAPQTEEVGGLNISRTVEIFSDTGVVEMWTENRRVKREI